MANIAVFGGTFNPFHIGHYQMLKALCSSDMLNKVFVIPNKIPPHKTLGNGATDNDRIEMCRLVCEDFSKAELCLIEFDREGKSYTVDTITELKKIYTNDRFFVACGADMLKTLDTWHDFDRLKQLVSFIVFNRDTDMRFSEDVKRIRSLGADIIVFNDEIISISSTHLRKCIKPEFLPKKVFDYVNKRGIYKQ